MIHRKQIAVISLVVVLMGLLLSMNIKGLVKPKEQRNVNGTVAGGPSAAASVSVESVSALAKPELTANFAKQVADLEEALSQAPGEKKIGLEKQLAQKWEDVNQPGPAAFYHEMVAVRENTYNAWLKTGDAFSNAQQNTQDTLIQPALGEKAINAYQKALELQPGSRDAKMGLGAAYVNGSANPMAGIQLLLAVVKEDPDNLKANKTLGLFSMRSGQFDKAVNRFKTVIRVKEDSESWFYLATSYENLGMKKDAIDAYEKSKVLAADPGLSKFVDKKVEELKK
ncbi:tetratricopeptide repeat protein [Hufsiella ginkgonis]|uniref:Tetratricopeptide repeat protein n=1 Tax=Hufsiella ginkgonis TaxID=2695274 RepID=A0A7K1XRU1_9SPHI|nr:tetratricopeptide repeat protein [Hufsiella ginkgonis]MXV13703.1 tetratricopeptide repeat protein [Hufsiella ginkgonis]